MTCNSSSLVPPRIDGLLNTIFSSWKQVETDRELETIRIDPSIRDAFHGVVTCWTSRVCDEQFSKQAACDDAEAAAQEIIDNASEEFREDIDNIVYQAAKYKIPQVLSRMSATDSYDSTCAQQLMCCVLDDLRNLNIEGLVNNALQLKLDNIREYAKIQVAITDANSRQWDVATRQYEFHDEDTDVNNSISPTIATELPIILFGGALVSFLMDELLGDFLEKQVAEQIKLVCACANPGANCP